MKRLFHSPAAASMATSSRPIRACYHTLRKKLAETERRLHETEERLQVALEGANEALWDWDIQRNSTYYSDQWSRMLGYEPEEIGNSVSIFDELVHPADLVIAKRKLDEHLTGLSEVYQAEFRMKTKQGAWRWIQARGKVVRKTADGSPARVAGTHLDVTEHKALVAALGEARDAALAAARSKSIFLANMSHEIRTPLNGILGISELLVETVRNQPAGEYAELIYGSAESLLAILNDILDFSRIEAGKMRVERVPFDLHELVHNVLNLFSRSLERKNLKAAVEIEPEVPALVEGDPGRLRQVLLNLVGNAVKFTEHGGITVRCRCTTRTAERAEVELEVADTGPGIPPARLEALFQPFTQADDSITRRHGGTGLGLSISKQLVHLMRGRIDVESTLGSGSRFRFTVVLDVPSSSSCDPPVVPKPRVRAAPIRQARVLLAEDSPVNQRVASSQLARLGYMVELVSNGVEAVKAARRGDFDVILMDCHMPELSGIEAARQICVELGSSKPPIIALTASALEEDRDRCLAAGMDAFISKPVKLDALAKVLAEWVPESC